MNFQLQTQEECCKQLKLVDCLLLLNLKPTVLLNFLNQKYKLVGSAYSLCSSAKVQSLGLSGHGLKNEFKSVIQLVGLTKQLLIWYSSHDLNNKLVPGTWIAEQV